MSKLICVLLIMSMSWVSLPAKAESAEVEALRAETKVGFENVLKDMQAAAKALNEQNEKLNNLNDRVIKLEKRRKHRAVESLTERNHE